MSLRDSILAADDSAIEPIALPEWGEGLFLRVWTGSERDKIEYRFTTTKGNHALGVRALVAVLSLCDKGGKRIFKDADEAEVAKKSSLVLDRIFQAAITLNGFGEDEVEEQVKNS